jgi:hypothetical protein
MIMPVSNFKKEEGLTGWVNGHPYTMVYIAVIVTVELAVLVIKL